MWFEQADDSHDSPYQEATMQPIKLDEDIRPLSEFRAGVAQLPASS